MSCHFLMQLIISSIDTPKMVNSPAFWEGHAGLVHSSMSEGVQLGSFKELMSTVPIRLHLIMGGSILGPEIPPPGILSHDLFCQRTHRMGPQDVFYFPFHGNCKYAQFPRAIPL